MSKLGKDKESRIKEQILEVLYNTFPKMFYTKELADEILRKDEFILKLLLELKRTGLLNIYEEKKGRGVRRKWSMSQKVYEEYKKLY
ncbi:MAG: hypothetical protein KJ674_02865 [Nanoarchaeota archaeon]|nr:hypothetical protein [Nanoarchaeota archaeon]